MYYGIYCNGSLTESYLDSLSGTMLPPLTANLGEERSMLSPVASPAKISQSPALEQGLLDFDQDFGSPSPGSSEKFSRTTSSSKTHLISETRDWRLFWKTFGSWGTMRNGELSALTMPAHLTKETASGSWPTPSATPRGAHTGEIAGSVSPDGMSRVSAGGTRFGATLETAVANSMKRFATPQARDFRTGQESRWDNLDRETFPTPIARDRGTDAPNRTGGPSLGVYVRQRETWPTPTVNDSKNSTLPPSQITHDNIPGQMLRQGEVAGGQLNSDWVEWLMGWPIGWTGLKPLAMDRFHQWLLSHGKF